MIRSSEIMDLAHRFFQPLEVKPYYGNVVAPLVSAIKGSSVDSSEILGVLAHSVALENLLIERGVLSTHYAAFVGAPIERASSRI